MSDVRLSEEQRELSDAELRFLAENATQVGGMNTKPMGLGILRLLDRLAGLEAERDRAALARVKAITDEHAGCSCPTQWLLDQIRAAMQ